jgi:hypothetical protein
LLYFTFITIIFFISFRYISLYLNILYFTQILRYKLMYLSEIFFISLRYTQAYVLRYISLCMCMYLSEIKNISLRYIFFISLRYIHTYTQAYVSEWNKEYFTQMHKLVYVSEWNILYFTQLHKLVLLLLFLPAVEFRVFLITMSCTCLYRWWTVYCWFLGFFLDK